MQICDIEKAYAEYLVEYETFVKSLPAKRSADLALKESKRKRKTATKRKSTSDNKESMINDDDEIMEPMSVMPNVEETDDEKDDDESDTQSVYSMVGSSKTQVTDESKPTTSQTTTTTTTTTTAATTSTATSNTNNIKKVAADTQPSQPNHTDDKKDDSKELEAFVEQNSQRSEKYVFSILLAFTFVQLDYLLIYCVVFVVVATTCHSAFSIFIQDEIKSGVSKKLTKPAFNSFLEQAGRKWIALSESEKSAFEARFNDSKKQLKNSIKEFLAVRGIHRRCVVFLCWYILTPLLQSIVFFQRKNK